METMRDIMMKEEKDVQKQFSFSEIKESLLAETIVLKQPKDKDVMQVILELIAKKKS